jgi:uncharacterized coiled-coil DUF342 family protein
VNLNDAVLTLIAELRIRIEEVGAERDAIAAKNDELHAVIVERDLTIAQLHEHVAVLEPRPARSSS